MKEPEDAGNYQVNNDGPVQGQVIGDNNTVHQQWITQHIHDVKDKAASTKPQRVWNIPYLRNDYFTGRQEILAELHTRFKANNATALSQRHAMSGLGGIGKTQTAVEYAYRYYKEYQSVLWARAESHETLTSSFVEIATLLELPQKDEQDQTLTINAVKRWLQDNKGWLLILDNADEPEIVREFLPKKCDGHILLTTRAQALGGLAQRIEIDTMELDIGALLLLRRAGLVAHDASLEVAALADISIAKEITKELGGLPLALDQAGAYIEETSCSLSDYLSLYRTRRAEVLKERGGLTDDHPDSVATTWSLSFQRVEEKNATAADLLRLCAFMAPEAIPEEIVVAGAEHLGLLLQAAANNPMALNKAIAALGAYSLIRRDPAEKTLSIHRLVQAVLRDAMADDEEKVWAKRTVLAVNAAFPEPEFAQWSACERCLSHAQACTVLIKQEHLKNPEAADLLTHIGWYLEKRGQYAEAEPPLQYAMTIREQQRESKDLDIAFTANTLGWLYYEQGKYEEAELLYLRALAIREQQLGPQHTFTATVLNNLALLYQTQGKFEQAKDLLKRALQICEQRLGETHHDTAISLSNLAALYRLQGKFELAEPLYQRILAIDKKVLGPEHPDTAQSLNNLAELYYIQGKYGQAESLLKRAFSIGEKALGPEHPKIAPELNNLAVLYQDQGKFEQAEPFYLRALAICEKQLGPQHPSTATNLNSLATLYRDQGKFGQAEPLLVRALSIDEKALGPEHPKVATDLNNLAVLYQDQGKFELAEPLLLRALAIREKLLEPEHPSIATSLNNLALRYSNQGKYELAEPLLLRALAIHEKLWGPEHPNTATSLNNLAELYRVQSKFEQAEPLYVRAIAILEQVLGPQHPDTQQGRQNYAALLRAMGRNEEAKQIEEGQ